MNKEAFGRNGLWQNFFRKQDEDSRRLEKLLAGVPVFSGLSGRELARIEALVHRRRYDAGEFIFSQGDPGLGMYVIEDGEVEVISADGNGKESRLAKLSAGDFFGELSLFDESVRSASAVARTHSKLVGFFRPDLLALLDRSPRTGTRLLLKLGEIISARLRITNEQLSDVSAKS